MLQEVYLKNYVDWELVRGFVNDLNWNGIIKLGIIAKGSPVAWFRDKVPKRTSVIKKDDKPWFDDRYVLTHRMK